VNAAFAIYVGGCLLVDIQAFILSIGLFHHRQRNLSQASVTESSVALPPATGSTTMTTSAFSLRSDASAFDPDNIRILSNAFEDAWQSLQPPGTTFHLDGQADQAREILARCIIEMAKLGERDQRKLRDAALAHLAERIFGTRGIKAASVGCGRASTLDGCRLLTCGPQSGRTSAPR
jgi:hypothetical protein